MHGFRARSAAMGLAALLPLGCADLASVTPNFCGNGVIESGEDCDSTDRQTSQHACGAPSSTAACRWICTYDGSMACPDGFFCGTDDICRRPMPQTFVPGSPVAQGKVDQILVADFDGDGVDDAVSVGASTVDLYYFESAPGAAASTLEGHTLFASGARPAVGKLGKKIGMGDTETFQPPSLALPLSLGLGVFTGGTYRTLSSESYASISLTSATWRAQPFLWTKPAGVETDFFVYNESSIDIFVPPAEQTPFVDYAKDDSRQGSGVVSRFDTTQACGQLALAFNNPAGGHIKVWSPCAVGPSQLVAEVSLPALTVVRPDRPLHLADVDFDGNADLVISTLDNKLFVAYADGTGRFAATPGGVLGTKVQLTTAIDMQATDDSPLPAGGTNEVLAVGDINGDCALDYVDSGNVYVSIGLPIPDGGCPKGSVPAGPYHYLSTAVPPAMQSWTEAVVADMNGDGIGDVVVGSANFPGVTLYRGTGTLLFNPYSFPTSSPTKSFSIGDFDGDLVPDLMYAEVGPGTSDSAITQDTLYVSFGARSGPPSDPVALAQIDGVSEIIAAKEEDIYGDLIDNAVVVAGDGSDTEVYLFPGNSARQVVAPFFMLQQAAFDAPVRSVMGSFTGRTYTYTDKDNQTTEVPLGDIAVFSRSLSCAKGPTAADADCGHFWLLPTLGDAQIDPATKLAPPGMLPAAFGAAQDVLLANLGPAGDGKNDTLAAAVASGMSSTLAVATAAGAGTAATFSIASQTLDTGGFVLSGGAQMVAADVDGQGKKDVVLASIAGGVGVWLWDGTALAKGPSIAYDAIQTTCPGAAPQDGLAIAAFPAGADGKQALVAVVPNGAVLLTYDGSKITPTCLPNVVGGSAVAVGDFNGDALPDILVAAPQGLVVHRGAAFEPGASSSYGASQ